MSEIEGMDSVVEIFTDGDSVAPYVVKYANGGVYKYKTLGAMMADVREAVKGGLRDGN